MKLQFFSTYHRGQWWPGQINLAEPPYLTEGLRVSIIAGSGGGKSNTLAVLAEEAHKNLLPFIFVDWTGDAVSLRELGEDVIVVGRSHHAAIRNAHFPLNQLGAAPSRFIDLVHDGFSLVVDTSGQDEEYRYLVFNSFLRTLFEVQEDIRTPVLLLIDEAHQFAPQVAYSEEQGESLRTVKSIMRDGRKRGMASVVATQRSQFISKDVIALANVRMFGKITLLNDYRDMKAYFPKDATFERVSRLNSGHFHISTEARDGWVQVKRRKTADLGETPAFRPARRERPKLSDLQMTLPGMQVLPLKPKGDTTYD